MPQNARAVHLNATPINGRIQLNTAVSFRNNDRFTWEGSVKPDTLLSTSPSQHAWVEHHPNGTVRFAVAPVKGMVRFKFSRAQSIQATNYTFAYDWDDNWHHIGFIADIGEEQYAITLDGGIVQEGKLLNAGVDGEGAAHVVEDTVPSRVTVGATYENGAYRNAWSGKIDGVRMWANERSANQMQTDLYDFVDVEASTGILAEWRFEETGSVTTAVKHSTVTGTWDGTYYHSTSTVASMPTTTDRPFLGDGDVDITPPSTPIMQAPSGVTANEFQLAWTGSTDDVYVQYYEVEVATTSDFSVAVGDWASRNVGRSLAVTVEGLAPNTNYYARVRAVDARQNASEWDTYSANQVITTLATGDREPPTAPVVMAPTNITASSFALSWTPSYDASGVIGYKLDVGLNSDFTAFLTPYRNVDLGNVTNTIVDEDTQPLTSYWLRVRAYDLAGNESRDSNVIQVTTEATPDTEAPNIVLTIPPESVEYNRFTARWNVGVDNVAVMGYRLDVARDSGFSDMLPGYENLDVGDVLYHNVSGCVPEATYFYRVRAYDAAGNVSPNTTTPETATTRRAALGETGVVPQGFVVEHDTYLSSVNGATNYGTEAVLAMSSVDAALVRFENLDYIGAVEAVSLTLPLVEGTLPATYTITYLGDLVWDESTATYNSLSGSLTGPSVEVTTTSATTIVSVDVTSLMNLALEAHSFHISTTTDTGGGFHARGSESGFASILDLEVNTSAAFEGTSQSYTLDESEDYRITNYIRAQTTPATKPGIALTAGNTITYDASDGYAGGDSYRCTYASGHTACAFNSPTSLNLLNVAEARCGIRVKAAAAGTQFTVSLFATYLDGTYDLATSTAFTVTEDWAWYTHVVPVNAAKEVNRFQMQVISFAAVDLSLDTPMVYVPKAPYLDIGFFSGESKNAAWDGTPHDSTASRAFTPMQGQVWYIGDNNENAAVSVEHRATGMTDWYVGGGDVTLDRASKVVDARVHGYRPFYNICRNPGFESATTQFWDHYWGADFLSIADTSDLQPASGSYCLKANLGTDFMCGAVTVPMPVVMGETVWVSLAFHAPKDESVWVSIGGFDTSYQWEEGPGESFVATGAWQRVSLSYTVTSASVVQFNVSIETASSFYLDDVLIHKGAVSPGPYLDGSMASGAWQGTPFLSETDLLMAADTSYDMLLTVTDPDAVYGATEFGGSVRQPMQLDYPLTTQDLTWTAEKDRVFIEATYLGDDNETATAAVDWKRTDLSQWTRVSHSWDRNTKRLIAEIAGLNPGTIYDMRVTYADTANVVYGTNPMTVQATTSTDVGFSTTPTRITFGGYALMDDRRSDIWVSEHDAFDHPDREVNIEKLARLDGSAELSDYWGSRRISMRGGISGRTRAELAENIAELSKALARGRQRLVVDTLDARSFYFTATCTRFSAPEVAGETFKHLKWTAEFTCADPFRYAASETTENAITLSNDGSIVVTNDGDLPIFPQFELVALGGEQAVQITLMNRTTGERITHVGTAVQGDTLVIDSERLRLLHNGVEADFQGSFPRLSVGQNAISVRLEPAVGQVQLTVRRRHRFL